MRTLQNKRVVDSILVVLGILLGGCAGEIATYRLAKEGSKAYNASDYHTALKKWQAGLEQARSSENKKDNRPTYPSTSSGRTVEHLIEQQL